MEKQGKKKVDNSNEILFKGLKNIQKILKKSALANKEKNWKRLKRLHTLTLLLGRGGRSPDIQAAYHLSQQLNWTLEHTKEKKWGYTRLAQWHEKVAQSGF